MYDQLGRLVAVYDSAGDAAVYSYDAVGNLLSIANSCAANFSAFRESSTSGPAGASVIIYGTGFCSNPTVTFNGTAAGVTSATPTQIVVTVPAGATSGEVAVSCGSSQINVGNFTITGGGGGAPSISGFSPTIGAAGTAVTISGTNFQPAVASNDVRVDQSLALVTAATSAAIGVVTPPTALTGHVSVATFYGTAVTSSYFFVPPAGSTAAGISFTGQMTIGGPAVTATVNSAGTQALLAFDGTAGQQIALNGTNASFACCVNTVEIFDPTGNVLASGSFNSGGVILSQVTLPATGTYTILVAPSGSSNTGSITLQLYSTPTVTGTMSIGGPADTVTTIPGQTATLTFTGGAGEPIALNITNSTYGCCVNAVYILNPDSSVLGSTTFNGGGGIIDGVTLPAAGTYSVYVAPAGANYGSMTLQLYDTTEVTGPIAPNGTPLNVTTAPGQQAAFTFSGNAGGLASLSITNSTYGCCWNPFSILSPDGSTLASTSINGSSGNIGPVALPTTGTYTVYVAPSGANSGTVTLQLWVSTNTLSVRGAFSDGNPWGTSISLNLPGSIQPGDFTVISVDSQSSNATFTAPTGWTALLNLAGVGVFYRINQSGDPSSVTFTTSQTVWMAAAGITYIGADQTNPIDAFNYWVFTTLNGGPPVPAYSRAPTLNPNYNGSQLLCGFFGNSNTGWSFSTPSGLFPEISSTPGPNAMLADEGLSDGTATGNFDAAGGPAGSIATRAGFQLAIKASGASAATPQAVTPSVGGEMANGPIYHGNNGTFTLDFGAIGVQNNDLLIVSVIPSDPAGTIGAPSGFSTIDSSTDGASTFQLLWQTGDPTTYTFNMASTYDTPHAWIIRGAGTGNAPQVDQHGVIYAASAASVSAPSLTPTTNSDLLLLMYGSYDWTGGSWTAPSGPTFDVSYGANPTDILVGSLPLVNESPTAQYTASFSSSGEMWAFAIAVEMPTQ